MHLNSHKAGVTLGNLVASIHFIWILLVILGWAQPLINFIMWAHMIHADEQVTGFSWSAGVALLVVTWIVGYAVGTGFARLWNRAHK